jgi:hypothetical protein
MKIDQYKVDTIRDESDLIVNMLRTTGRRSNIFMSFEEHHPSLSAKATGRASGCRQTISVDWHENIYQLHARGRSNNITIVHETSFLKNHNVIHIHKSSFFQIAVYFLNIIVY